MERQCWANAQYSRTKCLEVAGIPRQVDDKNLETLLDLSWYPEGSYKIGSVRPSVLPSVQAFSWNCIINFFLKFGMVLEFHVKLCVPEPDFLGNFFCPKKWENGPKTGFFQFIGKFGH